MAVAACDARSGYDMFDVSSCVIDVRVVLCASLALGRRVQEGETNPNMCVCVSSSQSLCLSIASDDLKLPKALTIGDSEALPVHELVDN